jgi:peptide deformylase
VVEGCLSIPGVYGKVVRSTYIELDYQDIDGKAESANFFGIEAIVIQHEIDHLDGVLFIDKASDVHIDFKK